MGKMWERERGVSRTKSRKRERVFLSMTES